MHTEADGKRYMTEQLSEAEARRVFTQYMLDTTKTDIELVCQTVISVVVADSAAAREPTLKPPKPVTEKCTKCGHEYPTYAYTTMPICYKCNNEINPLDIKITIGGEEVKLSETL
jgi:hypothetical protein